MNSKMIHLKLIIKRVVDQLIISSIKLKELSIEVIFIKEMIKRVLKNSKELIKVIIILQRNNKS
jgi:hypothetical protein